MARLEVSPSVRAICQTVADRQNVELVDVRHGRSGSNVTLEVVVDRNGDVDFDLITEVSRDLSDALDEDEDLIEGSYLLEVSSAGLERPLMKPSDYSRFAGREIKVVCREPVDGRNQFRGPISSAGTGTFTLDLRDRGTVEIPYEVVKKAHLWVNWEEELKRAEVIQVDERDEMSRRRKKSLEGRGR
ncbi:ribosome maturation factor RimP [soil metagenome]